MPCLPDFAAWQCRRKVRSWPCCAGQISDKERELEFTTLFKDVAGVIADKCINPDTQRPYTLSMIERALRDVHFSVDPKRGAKQQALQACPA